LTCNILSNFENPSNSLHTPRGNNNGTSSAEEQAVNDAASKTDVHMRSLGGFYGLVHLSRINFLSRRIFTAKIILTGQASPLQDV
jgi:hypothetical protein